MLVLPQEMIHKKRLGKELSEAELESFFAGLLRGTTSLEQTAAMLMAICFNGLTPSETTALTQIMRDSGARLDWGKDEKRAIDKHSTGGVGDKTSLIILPLCALEGVLVPMISGRGLGHTGGTVDKLESFAGLKMNLPLEELRHQVHELGGCFISQSADIAPLDQRLYHLRDVTGTVASVPLITASILSKKLAEGLGGLVMDVKFGSGAFMQDKHAAAELATSIATVGRLCGLKVCSFLTSMASPLGRTAGNILEVEECMAVLHGNGPEDTKTLSLELAASMVELAYPQRSRQDIMRTLTDHLTSGRAFERFCHIIRRQGGNTKPVERYPQSHFAPAPHSTICKATRSGYVTSIDVRALGLCVVALGGGRRKITDSIDHRVGLTQLKQAGERVEHGEPLAVIHCRSAADGEEAARLVQAAYSLGEVATTAQPLIWQKISST